MELQIFNFDGASQIRTIIKDGEPWFVAKDVTDTLGYSNGRDAVGKYCKSASSVAIHDGSQNRDMAIIPERDVYRLIVKSQLPSAERFEEWVFGEVLPTIRKTGKYEPTQTPELQIANALILAHQMIENNQKLIAEMKPKADFFDAVTDSKDAVDMACAAKVLNMGIGRTKLFSFLRDEKILRLNNQPYQEFIDRGYFRVIESSYQKPDGSTHISFKTVVYQKGLDFIGKRYTAYKAYREAA